MTWCNTKKGPGLQLNAVHGSGPHVLDVYINYIDYGNSQKKKKTKSVQ